MNAETTKIIDFLYTQIGASTETDCTEYSHLTDDERNQFMSHLINAVNILDSKTITVKPTTTLTCNYDNERDENAGSDCSNCGGTRTWCEGCRMWTSLCCETYGTCMCS
jgi:predicted Zn-ribbon and HTH transcriptional regulator